MADKKSKVKNGNHIVLHGWMINDLNLKGNELLVFAIIYGFSQEESQYFTGSLQYLADWTNSSKRGIQKNLDSLIAKGFIEKKEGYKNNVKYCKYHTKYYPDGTKFTSIERSSTGIEQSSIQYGTEFYGDIELSSSTHYNIIYNLADSIENIIIYGISGSPESGNKAEIPAESPKPTEQQKEKIPYKEIQETYNDICKSLPKIIKLSDKRKKTIKARLNDGYTVEQIKKAFEMAEASPFLRGEVNKSFHADFDWIFESDHLLRILENKYADRNAQNQPSTANNQMPESFMKLWK